MNLSSFLLSKWFIHVDRRCLPSLLLFLWTSVQGLPAFASSAFFATSNDAVENQIIRYRAMNNGVIAEDGRYPTGGRGTGKSLPAANSLVLSQDRRWLLTVNAGSDQVSVYRLGGSQRPRLTAVRFSGGNLPLSIATHGSRVYVLNSGSNDVASFRLTRSGGLEPLGDGTVRSLSSTVAKATDLGVTTDGRSLVIAERGVDRLTTYAIGRNGVLAREPTSTETQAKAPYALSFFGQVVYSVFAGQNPGQSAVAAYRSRRRGVLDLLGTPIFSGQTAACWSTLSSRRHLLYTANAGSHNLTGFRLSPRGQLVMLQPDGVSVDTGVGNHPRDLTFSADGKTLAVILSGEQTMGVYRVGKDGSLTSQQIITRIPVAATGIVAN